MGSTTSPLESSMRNISEELRSSNMSNFTLVVIEGELINIYKQDTFDETVKKIVELRDSYENLTQKK